MRNGVFVDWLTISQHHPQGGLPIISGGIITHSDASGLVRFERNCSAGVSGSFDTSLRVACDGFGVLLSGNVGRFSRQDNLFNHGWSGTISAANRVLMGLGLPAFSARPPLPPGDTSRDKGAIVSRLDLTANFATGSEAQARALIRWLSARSVSRMKKGMAGDESVWWSNTRHMLKAYIKHIEMEKHGASLDEFAVNWCKERGVVRVEVELKKRLLNDMGLSHMGNINDEALVHLFEEQTSVLRAVDQSDEPDILTAVPKRSRAYAAAWLGGQDVSGLCCRATLFAHAKVLREYGLDIMTPRNIEQFPVRVRIIDLQPLEVPEWYNLEQAA